MEIKAGKYVITPSPNSIHFDLSEEKVSKSGKSEGQTSREFVGYDMSMAKILQVLSKEQVKKDKDIQTLEDLALKLLKTTEELAEVILKKLENG